MWSVERGCSTAGPADSLANVAATRDGDRATLPGGTAGTAGCLDRLLAVSSLTDFFVRGFWHRAANFLKWPGRYDLRIGAIGQDGH